MYFSRSGLTLHSAVFTANHAGTGGAISGGFSSVLFVTNSIFADNIALDYGGAVDCACASLVLEGYAAA